jgi:hypothetical protein
MILAVLVMTFLAVASSEPASAGSSRSDDFNRRNHYSVQVNNHRGHKLSFSKNKHEFREPQPKRHTWSRNDRFEHHRGPSRNDCRR